MLLKKTQNNKQANIIPLRKNLELSECPYFFLDCQKQQPTFFDVINHENFGWKWCSKEFDNKEFLSKHATLSTTVYEKRL